MEDVKEEIIKKPILEGSRRLRCGKAVNSN